MQTTGEMKIVSVKENTYIVEVTNCKNVDDDGTVLSEFDVAYYEIHAGSEDGAFDQVANGAGEYLGTDC